MEIGGVICLKQECASNYVFQPVQLTCMNIIRRHVYMTRFCCCRTMCSYSVVE